MNWYKKAQEIYRGDPEQISMQDYDPEYGVKQLGKELGSSAAEGPGIYFTSTPDNAQSYGKNITKITLNNPKILSKEDHKLPRTKIKTILSKIKKDTMETAISNWDENPYKGLQILINSIMLEDNPISQLMSIWADVFYHQNPNEFMQIMTQNGIDGIVIPKKDLNHYVIYNRNLLR